MLRNTDLECVLEDWIAWEHHLSNEKTRQKRKNFTILRQDGQNTSYLRLRFGFSFISGCFSFTPKVSNILF